MPGKKYTAVRTDYLTERKGTPIVSLRLMALAEDISYNVHELESSSQQHHQPYNEVNQYMMLSQSSSNTEASISTILQCSYITTHYTCTFHCENRSDA